MGLLHYVKFHKLYSHNTDFDEVFIGKNKQIFSYFLFYMFILHKIWYNTSIKKTGNVIAEIFPTEQNGVDI